MRKAMVAFLGVVLVMTAAGQTPDEIVMSRVGATHKQLQTFLDAIGAYLTDYDAPPKVDSIDALAAALQPTYIRELPRADAWGTPFKYEVDGNDYRVVSAGADRKFDPSTWKTQWRGSDFNADAVVSNGKFVRAWDPDSGKSAALQSAVVNAQTEHLMGIINRLPEKERMPFFWKTVTVQDMDHLASALTKYRAAKHRYPAAATMEELKAALFPDYIDEWRDTDAWQTQFRYVVTKDGSSYTLASAGSDKQFKPESWNADGEFESDAEDAVIRDGKSVRRWKMPH